MYLKILNLSKDIYSRRDLIAIGIQSFVGVSVLKYTIPDSKTYPYRLESVVKFSENRVDYIQGRIAWIKIREIRNLRNLYVKRGLMASDFLHKISENSHQTCYFFTSESAVKSWLKDSEAYIDFEKGKSLGHFAHQAIKNPMRFHFFKKA